MLGARVTETFPTTLNVFQNPTISCIGRQVSVMSSVIKVYPKLNRIQRSDFQD